MPPLEDFFGAFGACLGSRGLRGRGLFRGLLGRLLLRGLLFARLLLGALLGLLLLFLGRVLFFILRPGGAVPLLLRGFGRGFFRRLRFGERLLDQLGRGLFHRLPGLFLLRAAFDDRTLFERVKPHAELFVGQFSTDFFFICHKCTSMFYAISNCSYQNPAEKITKSEPILQLLTRSCPIHETGQHPRRKGHQSQ